MFTLASGTSGEYAGSAMSSIAVRVDPAARGASPEDFQNLCAAVGKDSAIGQWLHVLSQLEAVREDGAALIGELYTFRSCVPAIPPDKDLSPEQNKLLKSTAFNVLKDEVAKLYALLDFKNAADAALQSAVPMLAGDASRVIPDPVWAAMAGLGDVVMALDALVEQKASTKNQLSAFKRIFAEVEAELPAEAELLKTKNETTQLLIAAPGGLARSSKDALRAATGGQVAMIRMLNWAVHAVKNRAWITPDEKFGLVRAMMWAWTMLDSAPDASDRAGIAGTAWAISDLDSKSVWDIFRAHPALPIVGDVPMFTRAVLSRSASLISNPLLLESKLGRVDDEAHELARQADLCSAWRDLEAELEAWTVEWSPAVAGAEQALRFMPDFEQRLPQSTPPAIQQLWDGADAGITLACKISVAIREAAAARAAQPAPLERLSAAGIDPRRPGISYDRAVRLAWTLPERTVLAQAISSLHLLVSELQQVATKFGRLLALHAYTWTQRLAHGLLTGQLVKARRKRNTKLEEALLKARLLAAEWTSGEVHGSAAAEEAAYQQAAMEPKSKTDPTAIPASQPAGRTVGMTAAQCLAFSMAIQIIVNPESELIKGSKLKLKAPIIPEKVKTLQDSAVCAMRMPSVLALAATAAACGDLSQLWYRELHLDRDKAVQAAIDYSLPWVLIEHALGSRSPVALRALPALLSLYNDAGFAALHRFGVRFLFDEVEAEADLAVSQLAYLLATAMWNQAKAVAAGEQWSPAALQLWEALRTSVANGAAPDVGRKDAEVLQFIEAMSGKRGAGGLALGAGARELQGMSMEGFDALCQCRDFRLLGRSIDWAALIGPQVHALLVADLKKSLSKLDTLGVAGIMDYAVTLRILQGAHAAAGVLVNLPPFITLRRGVEGEMSPVMDGPHACSSLGISILQALCNDLLPNFVFSADTLRFVRGRVDEQSAEDAVDAANREQKAGQKRFGVLDKAQATPLADATKDLQRCFGLEHAAALVALLGTAGVSIVVGVLTQSALEAISQKLVLFFPTLMDGLPPTRLAPAKMAAAGAYLWYSAKFTNLRNYHDMKTQVWQGLKEAGNALALIHLLETALAEADLHDFMATAPWANAPGMSSSTMPPLSESTTATSAPLKRIAEGVASLDAPSAVRLGSKAGNGLASAAAAAIEQARELKTTPPLLAQAMAALCERLHVADQDGNEGLGQFLGVPPQAADEVAAEALNDVAHSQEWHRLWSAMIFVMAQPNPSVIAAAEPVLDKLQRTDKPERRALLRSQLLQAGAAQFSTLGDGWIWAGVAMTLATKQWHRWQVADASTRVVRIADWENAMLASTDVMADMGMTGLFNGLLQVQMTARGLPPKDRLESAAFLIAAQRVLQRAQSARQLLSAVLPSPLPADESIDLAGPAAELVRFQAPETWDWREALTSGVAGVGPGAAMSIGSRMSLSSRMSVGPGQLPAAPAPAPAPAGGGAPPPVPTQAPGSQPPPVPSR